MGNYHSSHGTGEERKMPNRCKNLIMHVFYGCQVKNHSYADLLKSLPILFSSYVGCPYVNLTMHAWKVDL